MLNSQAEVPEGANEISYIPHHNPCLSLLAPSEVLPFRLYAKNKPSTGSDFTKINESSHRCPDVPSSSAEEA